MKWYVLVEGRQTEKRIYQSWIDHAFLGMQRVMRIEDMTEQRYSLLIGNGYPSYLDRLHKAIAEITDDTSRFDELVVCVDAEEDSAEARRAEIADIIREHDCPVPSMIIVHDCCIETWLLGHVKFARPNPHDEQLRDFYAFYDVRQHDPEEMPARDGYANRAQLHTPTFARYFTRKNQRYTKRSPGLAADPSYLRALVSRHESTGHLASFGYLLDAWRQHGAAI